MRQELAVHLHFIGPAAMEMREIVFFSVQVQGTRRIVLKFHGLLAAIQDLRMGDDDVLFLISVIDEFDFQERNIVFQTDFRRDDISLVMDLMSRIIQLRIMVTIGVPDMESRFPDISATGGRISHGAAAVVVGTVGGEIQECFRIADEGAVMERLQDAVLLDAKDKLGLGGVHGNHLFPDRRNLHDRVLIRFFLLLPGRCGRNRHQKDKGGQDEDSCVFHSRFNRQRPFRQRDRRRGQSGPRRKANT